MQTFTAAALASPFSRPAARLCSRCQEPAISRLRASASGGSKSQSGSGGDHFTLAPPPPSQALGPYGLGLLKDLSDLNTLGEVGILFLLFEQVTATRATAPAGGRQTDKE